MVLLGLPGNVIASYLEGEGEGASDWAVRGKTSCSEDLYVESSTSSKDKIRKKEELNRKINFKNKEKIKNKNTMTS